MEPITITTSLWNLLEDSKIVIPTFQRDYAQGRVGKEELRKKFLTQIQTALSGEKELLLDFVYGTKIDGTIYPLDGQQRLTTIWTLMWYATLKTNEEEKWKKRLERLKKFTYETRESSKDFMTWLCKCETICNLRKEKGALLSDSIQMQSGFHLEWNQDPTVQSILRMLSGTSTKKKQNKKEEIIPNNDGIEQIFNGAYDYLENLFDNSRIKFYHLDLTGIKQPDNLYVKMNARGEQLTGFENFKADLIEECLKNEKLKKYVTPGEDKYILTKWDINWTNIFWKNKDDEQNNIDDIFFTFIKRFLLNRYNANYQNKNDNEENKNNKGKDKIYTLLYEKEQEEYTSYNHYAELINEDCIDKLTILLDNIAKIPTFWKEIHTQVPLLRIKKFTFLPKETNKEKVKEKDIDKSDYSLQERVVMYGICMYLQHVNIDNNISDNFKHWLRVLSNLAYYKELPTYPSYRTRLKFIKELVDKLVNTNNSFPDIYSKETLNMLKNKYQADNSENDDETEANKVQLIEEIKKIEEINNNRNAEKTFEELESLWIFSGNINCLLEDNLWKTEKLYETIKDYISDTNTTFLCSEDKLTTLFQAILAQAKDLQLDVIKINDEHDGLRKLLNDKLKQPFQEVLRNILKNENREDAITKIITEYKKVDWKYALIKDKGLWNYASRGIFKKYQKHYYLYKGNNKNEADIQLIGYGKFISEKYKDQLITSEITFNNSIWNIKINDKQQYSTKDWEYYNELANQIDQS